MYVRCLLFRFHYTITFPFLHLNYSHLPHPQISYIPTSVEDSLIQLNRPDCLWKLSRDLLYLFVYHPTADFSMPLNDLLAVYTDCFGQKFVPAVYAAKTFQQLMGGKHMLKVMKVGMIKLTAVSKMCEMAILVFVIKPIPAFKCLLCSLVPRPCPAFHCLQYGKVGEGLVSFLFSCPAGLAWWYTVVLCLLAS